MAQPVIQPSFASGELSPSLYARVDLAKYHVGAALLRNFFVDYRGGISNRSGTMYVGECINSDLPNRLISFTFSTLQTYDLVFGDHTMRVIMNGGLVLEPSFTINAISQATIGVFSIPGNNFAVGDWVFIANVVGMKQVNQKTLVVSSVSGSNIDFTDIDGNNINTSAYDAYISGGTAARIFTLVTPYAANDLDLLKFSQSADTMTLTHGAGLYPPYQLTRTQHYVWTLTLINFASKVISPTGVGATTNTAGTTTYTYVVTAFGNNGVTESLPSISSSIASAALSVIAACRNTISWTAVANATQYNIYRTPENVGGAPVTGALLGLIGTVDGTGTSFIDNNITPDFTQTPPLANNPFANGNNPFCSTYFQGRQVFGGEVNAPDAIAASKSGDFLNFDYSTPGRDNDSIEFNIASQQVNAIKHIVPMISMITLTGSSAWRVDAGQQFDAITPTHFQAVPQAYNGCSDVPPIVINYDILYVQARGSIVRDLSYNFFVNVYTGQDMTVLSNHLFYGHQILEWAYAEEPFKIIWCVREDGMMLSLTYLKEQDVYGWAHHDTQGRFTSVSSIIEGDENVVYLIVERYLRGKYRRIIERMASRQMNADPTQNIPADLTKAWFVDCGLQYPLTYPSATLTPFIGNGIPSDPYGGIPLIAGVQIINGGSGYISPVVTDLSGSGTTFTVTVVAGVITSVVPFGGSNVINPILEVSDVSGNGAVLQAIVQSNVTMNSNSSIFSSANIGNVVRINNGVGIVVAAPTVSSILVNMTTPMINTWPSESGSWSMTKPINTVTGLDHLNGQMVAILADGNVQPQQLVVDGAVTLQQPATAIVVGLSYKAQMQSLYLDIPENGGTVQTKRKKIPVVTVRVQDSRGLKIGPNFSELQEIKERTTEPMGQAIKAITGDERVLISPNMTTQGQICAQQDQPLPATILGLMPELAIGDTP